MRSRGPFAKSSRMPETFGYLALIVMGLMLKEQYELNGSWAEYDLVAGDISGVAGVISCILVSWTLKGLDLQYYAAVSVKRFTLFRNRIAGVIWRTLTVYLSILLLLAIETLGGKPGGSPQHLIYISYVAWIVVVGPSIAILFALFLRHRGQFAVLSSTVGITILLLSTYLSSSGGGFPRLAVFWTKNFASSRGWSLEPEGSVVNTAALALTIVISLMIALAVMGIYYYDVNTQSMRKNGLTCLVILLIALAGLLPYFHSSFQSILAARPSSDSPSCTKLTPDGAEFCSWPEDQEIIERLDSNWREFVQYSNSLGMSMSNTRIAVQNSTKDPDLEIAGISFRSTQSVYKRITGARLDNFVSACREKVSVDDLVNLHRLAEQISNEIAAKYGDNKAFIPDREQNYSVDKPGAKSSVQEILNCRS